MPSLLEGKVAIITGASRGIGRSTAKLLASHGAGLVLNYHRAEAQAESLARDLARVIGRERVVLVRGDVALPATAEALVRVAGERFGRADILVNNAGISVHQPILGHPDDVLMRQISVNLLGPFYCSRAVVPLMLESGGGRIVNIASQMGLIGAEGYAAYCASKAGLIGLTKALARELAPARILVNCVAPGPVETDMLKTGSPEYNDGTRSSLPVRRWGSPDEIAESILFLCGSGGAFYAGQVLSPNGGSVM